MVSWQHMGQNGHITWQKMKLLHNPLPSASRLVIHDQIDAAYRTKYRRYAATYVSLLVSAEARAATLKLVQAIIEDANAHGIKLMIFETFRSQERQAFLFDQGATRLKKVGVHHYGLACDLVKDINGEPSWKGDFSLLGTLAHQHGLSSVELPLRGMLPDLDRDSLDRLRAALQEYDLELVVDTGVVETDDAVMSEFELKMLVREFDMRVAVRFGWKIETDWLIQRRTIRLICAQVGDEQTQGRTGAVKV